MWPRPWTSMWPLVAPWAMDITAPDYDRTTDTDKAAARHGCRHSCRWQHRPPISTQLLQESTFQTPIWPQMMRKHPGISVAFNSISKHEHQLRLWLLQDHKSRHGPPLQPGRGITMETLATAGPRIKTWPWTAAGPRHHHGTLWQRRPLSCLPWL